MEKCVYIVLSHTGSTFSRMIKHFMNSTYTHASIAFDEHLQEIYSFGRLRPNNPFTAGFIKEDIQKGTFAKFENTYSTIFRVPVEKEQYDILLENMEQFKRDPDRYSYNLIGALALKFGLVIERENRYFCSHFVAEMLNESKIMDFEKTPSRVIPMDIYRKAEVYPVVYDGKLSQYAKQVRYAE